MRRPADRSPARTPGDEVRSRRRQDRRTSVRGGRGRRVGASTECMDRARRGQRTHGASGTCAGPAAIARYRRRRRSDEGLGAIRMQPDVAGLTLATGVLAGAIWVFWFADRMISGPVGELSYTIGRQIARGVAEWAAARPSTRGERRFDDGRAEPGGGAGNGGNRRDGGADGTGDGLTGDLVEPVLVRVTGGRPRLRLECRLRGHGDVRTATLRRPLRPAGWAYGIPLTRALPTGTIAP